MLVVLFASTAFAQQLSYGGNLELAVPMGHFGDCVNMGFGLSAQAEYPVKDNIVATGSLGYLMWNGKDIYEDMDYSWSCIPIKVGGKYNLNDTGFYGIVEMGLYMFSIKWDYEYMGFSVKGDDSKTNFGFAPGVGYQMPFNDKIKLDFSLQYETAGDYDFLGLDLGVRF